MNNKILTITIFCYTDHAVAYINYTDGRKVVHRSTKERPHRLHRDILEYMKGADFTIDQTDRCVILQYGAVDFKEILK